MKRIVVMTALILGAMTATGTTTAAAAPPFPPEAPKVTLVATTAAPTAAGTYFVTATLSWKKVARTDIYAVCVLNVTSDGGSCIGVVPAAKRFTTSEDFVGEVPAGTVLQYSVKACYTDPRRPGGCTSSDKITVNVP